MIDPTMTAMHAAMRNLAVRRRQQADNIANAATPGYTATKVDFEDALSSAIDNGDDPFSIVPTATHTSDPARQDGNNVNLDTEMIGLQDTDLKYETLTQAMNAKFRLLRTAIKGGAA